VHSAGEQGARPLVAALSIVLVAPSLSWYYRNVASRRAIRADVDTTVRLPGLDSNQQPFG
jgi:hypothetical protein